MNNRHSQRGAALFFGLIMLLLITIIAVAASQSQTTELRMAGNTQKHNITLQTAETALRYAEAQLQQGIYTNFSANANGLYNCNPSCTTSGTPWYLAPPSVLTYNGPSLSSNADQSGSAPSPTYIIENLPVVALPGSNAATSGSYGSNGTPPVVLYRITAYGTGADHTSQVLLQSIFY